jgi:hypothetical protein
MSVKDIIVKPISSQDASRVVKSCHYSGKVVQNSQLHFGVFLNGKCGGAMQFGPSLDKRKMQGLVENTGWNGFIELNRMAFADWLPRNSESRAIAVAMRLIRKAYPHIEWVVSFADGTQCGDGTIYRASGFVLTGIKKNREIWILSDGQRIATSSLRPGIGTMKHAGKTNGGSSMSSFRNDGGKPLPGFQLRYIYFLNPAARSRLTVPVLPFSDIAKAGAGMYLGKQRVRSSETTGHPPEERQGSTDPDAPHA